MGRIRKGGFQFSIASATRKFATVGEVCVSSLLLMKLILLRYLWPDYNDNSSNHHVLLIALMVTMKSREGLPAWSTV